MIDPGRSANPDQSIMRSSYFLRTKLFNDETFTPSKGSEKFEVYSTQALLIRTLRSTTMVCTQFHIDLNSKQA